MQSVKWKVGKMREESWKHLLLPVASYFQAWLCFMAVTFAYLMVKSRYCRRTRCYF